MSCPRCGADNQCAVVSNEDVATTGQSKAAGCAGDLTCWCFQVPLTPAQRAFLPASSSCYCAACLQALVLEIAP